jgi:ABC-type nitrate/sulfonate/bicarbonate transport system substrate-binding protein
MRKFVSAALVFASLAMMQSAGAQQLLTLRYGVGLDGGGTGGAADQQGLGALTYIVGQRKGFFEQAGVRFEAVRPAPRPQTGNSGTLFDALAKGEIDMMRSQLSFLVRQMVLAGSDFAAVSGHTGNSLLTLMARPEIKSFDDLKGKTVALTVAHDLMTLSMRKMMEQHGIRKEDIRLIAITGSEPRAKCLRAGDCAAVIVVQPLDTTLAAEGYHALGNSHELPPMPYGADVVNRPWAVAHQETIVRYIRGLAATHRYINDPKNADEIRPIIMQATKASDAVARDLLTKYYYNPTHPSLPHQAEFDVEGFGRILGLMAEYGELAKPVPPIERFVDLRYAKAAGVQ